MKRTLALILTIAVTFSMVGCGKNSSQGKDQEKNEIISTQQSQNSGVQAQGEIGKAILEDFRTRIAKDSKISNRDMATELLTNSVIKFKGDVMDVEPGFLNGFSSEITGFKSGVSFGPIIGSIPFVGYIFTVEDGADVNAFMNTLKTQADLRWNVCTEADELIVDNVGNTVFFLMCPNSIAE